MQETHYISPRRCL